MKMTDLFLADLEREALRAAAYSSAFLKNATTGSRM
jgi:hypothetical protein